MLIEQPIAPKSVPHLDAVLVTHADNGHYSVPTDKDLKPVTREFHSTQYVNTLMKKDGRVAPVSCEIVSLLRVPPAPRLWGPGRSAHAVTTDFLSDALALFRWARVGTQAP